MPGSHHPAAKSTRRMMTPGSCHTAAKSTQRLLLARRVNFLVTEAKGSLQVATHCPGQNACLL